MKKRHSESGACSEENYFWDKKDGRGKKGENNRHSARVFERQSNFEKVEHNNLNNMNNESNCKSYYSSGSFNLSHNHRERKDFSEPHSRNQDASFVDKDVADISYYDSLENLRMQTQNLLTSLKYISQIVMESSPDLDDTQEVFYYSNIHTF